MAEPIARALADESYVTPTPIQAQTVPLALQGRDVIGIAQTGTGKTAAFALPILQRLIDDPRQADRKTCRVLVLSPTRELSSQILDSFRAYARHMKLTSDLAIGGVSMGRQVRAVLGGLDVLVATPGRLLDLVQSNALKLSSVEVLVLDEADRMLDMGFIHDIRKIVARLPKDRQTLFFSATMPQAIAELAGEMLRDPSRVSVTPQASTAEKIDQRVVRVDKPAKPTVLADILRSEPIDRCLVFTRTKHGADKVVRGLVKVGIGAEAIHGNKSQNQRERVLAAFRAGDTRVLVATDIAARGIDVEGVSHVINYDLPNIPESYVHRIGRTARAGAEGVAISFCDAEEVAYLRDIETLIRMRIPSTDRRAERSAARTEAAAPNRETSSRGRRGRSQETRPQETRPQGTRPRGTRPEGTRAQEARSQEARSQEARSQEARSHEPRSHEPRAHQPRRDDGRPQQDRRQDRARPDQARPQQARQQQGRQQQARQEQPQARQQQPRQPSAEPRRQPARGEPRTRNGDRSPDRKAAHFEPVRVGAPLPHSTNHRETAVETALDSVAFLRRSVPARRNHEQRPER